MQYEDLSMSLRRAHSVVNESANSKENFARIGERQHKLYQNHDPKMQEFI